jgi:hypothetical protein
MDATRYKFTLRPIALISIAALMLIATSFAQQYLAVSATAPQVNYSYVADIECTNDVKLTQDLADLLCRYHFSTPYELGKFDCTESSYAVQQVLLEHGYDSKIMYRLTDSPHAWVIVPDNKGAYATIETTIWESKDDPIGGVVIPSEVAAYNMTAGYVTNDPKGFLGLVIGSPATRINDKIMESVEQTPASPQ